jgi:peptide/nickel transport system substrate-binding protein
MVTRPSSSRRISGQRGQVAGSPHRRGTTARLRVSVALSAVLLVVACGSPAVTSSPTGSSPILSSPSDGSVGSCPPEETAKRGGTLVSAIEGEPAVLIAGTSRMTSQTAQAVHPIYSLLVELDSSFQPTSGLADTWEVSDDGLTYTFHLNPDALWHDGEPVTADDAVFTFEWLMENNPNGIMGVVESVDAADEQTFVVQLESPFAPLLTSLGNTNEYFAILPKHILEGQDIETAEQNMAPVGSGPFKFVEWVAGSHVELARNENFYVPCKPYLDRLILQFQPDPGGRKLAFENGELDFMYSYMIPFEEFAKYSTDPRFQIIQGGLGVGTTDFLVFNTKNEILQDKNVRKAIAHALDRKAYTESVMFGAAQVARSPINSSLNLFHTPEYDVYQFDPDQTESLLDDAGHPRGEDGVRFSLDLRVRSDRAFEVRGADIIKDRLEAVGIGVALRPGDAASVYSGVYNDFDFDMVIQLKVTGPDPAANLAIMFGEAGIGVVPGNGAQYVNPRLEELFPEDRRTTDLDRRVEIWHEVQQVVMDDLPWLPLFEFPAVQLGSGNVRDVVIGALDYQPSFVNAYIAKE